MNSTFWARMTAWAKWVSILTRTRSSLQRGRAAAAARLRQLVPGLKVGFAGYCVLLVLLGMVTAGFVIFPLGILLLLHGLVRDSLDRSLLGGLVLSLVGLFYLVGPILVIQVVSRVVFGRLGQHTERLADRLAGKD